MSGPTLEDVASRAGVSRATASRVMLRRGRFSEASRDAVEKAAEELGYVPNVLASDLASKQAHPIIGLLLRDVTNPAYALLFGELQAQARRRGLTMVTMTVVGDPSNAVQMDSIRRLLGVRVRALVVATGSVPSESLTPYSRDVCMVRTGRPEPSGLLNAVSYDEQAHGRMLAEHVWELGHRRVLVSHVPRHVSLPEFYRGRAMAARLTELGAQVDRLDVGSLDADQAAVVSVDRATSVGATCIMCPSDLRLLSVLCLAHQRGQVVGDRLSATGCDGILHGADVLGLTTLRLPVEHAAELTMDLLRQKIGGPRNAPATQLRVTGQLVPGRTLGPAPR